MDVCVIEEAHPDLADLVVAQAHLVHVGTAAVARDVGRKMRSNRYLGIVSEIVEGMPRHGRDLAVAVVISEQHMIPMRRRALIALGISESCVLLAHLRGLVTIIVGHVLELHV